MQHVRTATWVRPMLVPPGVIPIRMGPMEMPTGDRLTPVASAWMRRGEMLSATGSTSTPAGGARARQRRGGRGMHQAGASGWRSERRGGRAARHAPAGPNRKRQGCTVIAVAPTVVKTWELVATFGAFWNHVSLPKATLAARLGEILNSVCRPHASLAQALLAALFAGTLPALARRPRFRPSHAPRSPGRRSSAQSCTPGRTAEAGCSGTAGTSW